jgi:hypothetical protein
MSATTPQVQEVPAPQTVAEAIGSLHASSGRMAHAADRLLTLLEHQEEAPEMRRLRINPGNNGVYSALDKSYWQSKSIGIYNPSNFAPVFIGIAGVSVRPNGGAPFCPAQAALVLPVDVGDLELGCDPAVLLANECDVFLFRYVTRQQLMLSPT